MRVRRLVRQCLNYLQKNVFAQSQHRTQKVEEPEDDEGWVYGPDFTSNLAIEMVTRGTTLVLWSQHFAVPVGNSIYILSCSPH